MTYKGFNFVALGFTGKRAAKYKEKYIDAFEAMREQLQKQSVPQSQLEILAGAVNGLLEQDKKLKAIEGRMAKADVQASAIEKVSMR